jgi:hypothetical protein
MSRDLFTSGGPHNIRKTGRDEYTFSISVPPDEDGMLGRECPDDGCCPGYFKVRPGTGITDGQIEAFCPYCRRTAEPSGFLTQAQIDYGKRILERETVKGIDRSLRDALRLGPRGRRKLAGGPISMEISMTPARLPFVGRPLEEELRRDVKCRSCGLEHAVFGLATWCADCGTDIFIVHLGAELAVLRRMVDAADGRRSMLGPRVAARDVENALEDLVSVLEAVLKALTRRHLVSTGRTLEEAETFLERQVRNGFQNLTRARELLAAHTAAVLGRNRSQEDLASLAGVLEKRHPIAHNLGVVDRKYLGRIRSGELAGREVRVTADEVRQAIDQVESLLTDLHHQLFAAG